MNTNKPYISASQVLVILFFGILALSGWGQNQKYSAQNRIEAKTALEKGGDLATEKYINPIDQQTSPYDLETNKQNTATENSSEEKFNRMEKRLNQMDNGKQAGGKDQTFSALGALIRTVLALILVVLLIAVALKLLKGLQRKSLFTQSNSKGELLEVLETCHLGPQHKIVAIRMHDRICALGMSPNQVNLIRDFDISLDEWLLAQKNQPGNANHFNENLNRLLDRFKKPKSFSQLEETK